MIKVIDNCISEENQKFLIKTIIDNNYFPWFFGRDVTFQNGKQKRPAFSHYFVINRKENSSGIKVIQPLFKKYIKKEIINFKTVIQLPLNTKKNLPYDTPHVDSDEPHTVLLYYVCDSDGETVLFKNKKIYKKVEPKQGRLLIFDGKTLHTAYQPTKNIRCILNINEAK
tara:strand:- start:1353 stop:1859 length:507 start_codon:yes stop_codon:yes gene_type:complete